ncbi:MAG TPA: SUMF1/EgtB/PvdO family nonheme iron enzyme [Planctomycetota bacterium]|nr:SUMF1/EgtB/PvdO family nonheme iron enzyme [Planctomycetota bacterium]
MNGRTLAALVLLASPAALAQEAPKKETVLIPGTTVRFDLVSLPGGKVTIGSPEAEPGRKKDEAQREVELKPFWIGTHEVTWEEYSLYYESWRQAKVDGITRPSQPDVIDPKEPFENGADQGKRHPAISIGWYGATGYCEWLTKKTGQKYRLPTEAEWEYAARAGSKAAAPGPLDDHAWYKGNSGDHSHEVGKRKPNAFGLYDVFGNTWENCLEPFAPPAGAPVVRGGGWNTPAMDVRAANRQVVPDEWAERDPKRPLRLWWLTDGNFVGFRVVRVPGPDGKDAASKVEVKDLRIVKTGKRPDYLDRVSGEIVYTGDATLDEVEVTVFFLDEDGKPMMKDPKDKPCYSLVYPVLAGSAHGEAVRKPLKKGESRKFELDVPHPFLETGSLDLDKVQARVTHVRISQ